MTAYVFRRLLGLIPVLWVIVTLSFFLMRFAPGGPFDKERVLNKEVRANIERKYHLDEPITKQYLRYMSSLLRGDLGPSFRTQDETVNDIVRRTLPVTMRLGILALLVALGIGIPAGVISALRQNTATDYTAMTLALLGVSVPSFVLASLLVYVFGVKLGWVDVAGWGTWRTMLLPPLTLGMPYAAYVARLSRAGMLEVVRQDYIRVARAKGLIERVIIWRHMLRIGLLPVVSFLGPASAAVLTGSLVVERIFRIPGIGMDFVTAALNRDYTMVLGTVIVYSTLLVVLNLVVDILYAFLDPRITYK